MDWKQFIAQIVSSTVWPVLAITILLIFRQELVRIGHRLAHLKYKDLELEFEKVKQQAEEVGREARFDTPTSKNPAFSSLEDQIFDLLDRAPSAAIILSWSGLESALASAVARLALSPEPPSYRSPMHNIDTLSKNGGLSESQARLIMAMKELRNRVVHVKDSMLSMTQDNALSYANAAIKMIHHLDQLKRKS